jgi:16S rRNA (uracil1498-N3)-methyltransferase
MTLFYAPEILFENCLPEEEARHALIVLRLKQGDNILVTDGKGAMYQVVVRLIHPKKCSVEITATLAENRTNPCKLHIGIAPVKNIERFEFFVEKATEIGIAQITPLLCRYSERKNINIERMQKIVVAAAKQSQKAHFPVINPMISFAEFVKTASSDEKFIAHCYEGEKALLKNVLKKNAETLVLIGPEGDFSPKEVNIATENGYLPVSLGDSRLRTETAGIVACNIVSLVNS